MDSTSGEGDEGKKVRKRSRLGKERGVCGVQKTRKRIRRKSHVTLCTLQNINSKYLCQLHTRADVHQYKSKIVPLLAILLSVSEFLTVLPKASDTDA